MMFRRKTIVGSQAELDALGRSQAGLSAEYREFWAILNRGQFQMAEFKWIAKDGHEVWIEASYNPVLDSSGKPLVIVKFATDETQKKLHGLADASTIAAVNRAHVARRARALLAGRDPVSAYGRT